MTTTLVLGGTGKTGSRIAARLRDLGTNVRIGSRTSEVPFDWDDDTTWTPALDDVDSAYVCYYPDVSFPGAAGRVAAFARTAVAHGARRLVMVSGRGEPEAVPAEDGVRGSGAEWTVLRCAWFAQNFSEHFLLQPVLQGVIALPAADVAEPFLDVNDVADVAVATLTRDGHAGRTYELTGPRLLTFADVAAELTRATGRGDRPAVRVVRPRARRAQRAPVRRRRAGAGPPASRLRRLRARRGGRRRLVGRRRRRAPMTGRYPRGLTVTAAIGVGLSAGVYLAFLTFVMPGLRKQPPAHAIDAMSSINKAAPGNPLLMLVLFGTGIACVPLMIAGFRHRDDPAAVWQIAGAGLYLVSALILVGYHVPHNDQLMKADPNAAGASATWSHFYTAWMAWNHARTLAAAGGAASLVLALRAR